MNCITLTIASHTPSFSIVFRLLFLDLHQDRNGFQQIPPSCHSELDEMVYSAEDYTCLRGRQIQRFEEYYPNQIGADLVELAKRIAPDFFHERYNAEELFPDSWIANTRSISGVLRTFRKTAKKLLEGHESQAVALFGLQEVEEAAEHKPAEKAAYNPAPQQATVRTTAGKQKPTSENESSTCKHANREIDALKATLDKEQERRAR
ncbi:uncharacterized protein B0J16DRAFT_388571 [Fusarium flagelliforme]|uniref:Uncharacterized protein n=1 Tax=Fusarium flagelliforme TaxID=2675880 RepID=A0A395M7Z6_9HYPO|nr:uncharacterized protein B0J16DRAFT_388571 [Fusarium flagelliforme]KAH7174744.1 hypothetical protein B0J16DRAFT_388571 [Fusarium flagelliforme]RFN44022.1 hypothetical protein FIE12Z_11727 [Fusarium flagelliforme]